MAQAQEELCAKATKRNAHSVELTKLHWESTKKGSYQNVAKAHELPASATATFCPTSKKNIKELQTIQQSPSVVNSNTLNSGPTIFASRAVNAQSWGH